MATTKVVLWSLILKLKMLKGFFKFFSLENQEMKMSEEPNTSSGNVWESHKFFLLYHRQYYCAACVPAGDEADMVLPVTEGL